MRHVLSLVLSRIKFRPYNLRTNPAAPNSHKMRNHPHQCERRELLKTNTGSCDILSDESTLMTWG